MSSETTRILFNSPALHSLKRDQLVKLCKLHSIKATGKNTELVEKLKRHAATLPLGSPLSVATRSEQPQDDANSSPQRPSEQWEIVTEDIPDVPGGFSKTTDEFGTGGGSEPSSVSSSLRTIANTFNLKRAISINKSDDDRMVQSNISDELASHSVPYSSIPESSPSDMPQTDHFKFTTPDTTVDEHIPALPGHPTPAPSGSTTGPLKTTIRLVSASNSNSNSYSNSTRSPEVGTPQLRPVDPPFSLLMGSPDAQGQSRVPVWPLSPQRAPSEGRLYPALPTDELDEAKKHQEKSKLPGNIAPFQPSDNVQDLFSLAPKPPGQQKERVGIPHNEPFLFGSPLPRHSVSNKAFDTAAASVLEEMNKRLSAVGVQNVEVDVFGTVPVTTADAKGDFRSLRASGTVDRFDKIHEEQFNKMDSIAAHYAAKRGVPGSKKRKSDVFGRDSAPAKKRSSAAPHKRMGIPGGFDDEDDVVDDVQEEADRRMSKRVRIFEEDGGKDKGRRLTLSPKKSEAEDRQAERERAAARKMLEVRKGKRRSSRHARASHIGPQAVSNKGKATPRFGILSSAKSIVRSVWNFGVGSPTKASKVSTTGTTQSNPASVAEPKERKPAALPPKNPIFPAVSRPPEAPLAKRKSIAPVRASSSTSSKSFAGGVAAKGRTSQSRQPSLRIISGTTKMINPAPVGGSIGSRQSVRASINAASSTGTKDTGNSRSSTGRPGVASTVAECTNNSRSNKSSNDNKVSIFSPTRVTSRLFAPTASSMAKVRGPSTVSKSKTNTIIAQRAKTPPRNAVLDAITNSPRGAGGNSSAGSPPPLNDKIFTTPLLLSPKQAVIPPPVKPSSLAAAASALAATTRSDTQSSERSLANRTTATMTTTTKGQLLSARKPRISRSRIIAKLGAQRAATATSTATSSSSRLPSSRPTVATATGSKIPRASGNAVRAPRVRSSMATATRRSYAGAKSVGRGSDVLMSAKKHVRQSEFVRRRSRMTGSTVGVASGAGGSHAVDGSMEMDIDED